MSEAVEEKLPFHLRGNYAPVFEERDDRALAQGLGRPGGGDRFHVLCFGSFRLFA